MHRTWTTDGDATMHEEPMDLGEHHEPSPDCWCRPRKSGDGLRHRPHWETVAYLGGRLETVKQQRSEARAEVKELKAELDTLVDRLEAAETELERLERERDSNVVSIDR